ncbi:insulin-like growth factor-binding protein 2 isoform X2 [Rhinolophus sinicus]|uniref:insulin-like growth factor-binding protein 2 isoform X2 n=1 Tax=Rhinolophus sinicus TaxID=89399 RepID=UPI003D7AFE8B
MRGGDGRKWCFPDFTLRNSASGSTSALCQRTWAPPHECQESSLPHTDRLSGLRTYPLQRTHEKCKVRVLGQEIKNFKQGKKENESQKDGGDDHAEGGLAENHVVGTTNMLGGGGSAGRKPLTSGMKELAVLREKVTEQHRQLGKGGKHHLGLEEPKKLRPPPARTPCQQELDQVLERISTMRLPDERGPLEHLYSLHIPNCDKHGLYNLKQCKMSLNGQRGECWCVNPNTGKLIQGAPTIRGDPECHRFYNEQQEARGVHTQRMQ